MKAEAARIIARFCIRATGDLGPFTFYSRGSEKTVFFLKAPPHKPPTWQQLSQRQRWINLLDVWAALPATVRTAWATLARLTHLQISGHNLFLHHYSRPQDLTVPTLLAQAGMTWNDLEPQEL